MFMTVGLGHQDTPERIAKYIAYGAKEFFIGYVPRTWLDKYGWEVGPNRRTMGPPYNFSQVSELREIVQCVHDNGGTVNFALNAHDNGAERMYMIEDMFNLFESMNPDGYIVADPAIMYCMKQWGINRPLHLSTGVGCFNSESVKFFCNEFNVTRVVIPRKLTIGEMKQLIDNVGIKGMEYEVMIINYRCYFNDEDCHSIHSGVCRNLCGAVTKSEHHVMNHFPSNWKAVVEEMQWPKENTFKEGGIVDQFMKDWHKTEPPQYPSYEFVHTGEGMSAELCDKTLSGSCGLCVIKSLRDIGVEVLKVPMRGNEDIKLNVIKMVNAVMTAENPTRAFCQSLVGSKDYCNSIRSCYYQIPKDVK